MVYPCAQEEEGGSPPSQVGATKVESCREEWKGLAP